MIRRLVRPGSQPPGQKFPKVIVICESCLKRSREQKDVLSSGMHVAFVIEIDFELDHLGIGVCKVIENVVCLH